MADYKPNKDTWFLSMGFADAYDYIAGRHPNTLDDEISTKEWVVDLQDNMEDIKSRRNEDG